MTMEKKAKVIRHLKNDMKMFKKEHKEDKKLVREIKKEAPSYKRKVKKEKEKIKKVMGEWESGDLHSGSSTGPIVKSRKQAVAIALSEAKRRKKK